MARIKRTGKRRKSNRSSSVMKVSRTRKGRTSKGRTSKGRTRKGKTKRRKSHKGGGMMSTIGSRLKAGAAALTHTHRYECAICHQPPTR